MKIGKLRIITCRPLISHRAINDLVCPASWLATLSEKKHLIEKVTMLRTHICGETVSASGTPKTCVGGNRKRASADLRQMLIMLS